MIDDKAILDWCFVIGSLNLGVFGFLYSTYASAKLASKDTPITGYIRTFCRMLVAVLFALAALAAYTAHIAKVGASAWIIVVCLVIVVLFAARLAYIMEK